MSKYQKLWEYIGNSGEESLLLPFAQAQQIAGTAIDHSFLIYKKELLAMGYRVEKISLKAQTILFCKEEA